MERERGMIREKVKDDGKKEKLQVRMRRRDQ